MHVTSVCVCMFLTDDHHRQNLSRQNFFIMKIHFVWGEKDIIIITTTIIIPATLLPFILSDWESIVE